MLLLTAAYVTVAFFQWRAIRETNAISARSLDAMACPVLALKRIEIPNLRASVSEYEIQIEVENVGKDIALDVRRATVAEPFFQNEHHRQPDENDLKLVRGQSHVPEGSSVKWKLRLHVDPNELDALRNKSANVGVLGYLVYDDRIGREHHFRFARFLDYNAGRSSWLYGPARDERDGVPDRRGPTDDATVGGRVTLVNSVTADIEER